jgi:hypothetical protein
MFHPFEGDLSELKDNEVEDRLQDLTKKYFVAQRMGNPQLLTQISTFVTIYRQELSKRYRLKMQSQNDRDLDQLINVN